MKRIVLGLGLAAVGALAVVGSSACGTGFDSVTKIQGVRILATKADKPYAKPGDTVNLTMLVADGRADKTVALTVSWVPAVCTNPISDLYYACFAPSYNDGGTSDASVGLGDGGATSDAGSSGASSSATSQGAIASLISKIPPHTNLTPFLPQGPTYSFTMPADIVSSHPLTKGAPRPYGLAILFNYACAGHLELVPFSGANPQQVPIACFDDQGNQLGAEDGLFGFMRVYGYTDLVNANPVISSFTQDGNPVDLAAGITLDHGGGKVKLTPVVPDTSWELNPDSLDSSGAPQHEEIWVDYYSTLGTFGGDARLLYDTQAGKIAKPEVEFTPPADPGEGTIWAVVHDNRGGVEWAVIPLHVK